jgi:hypothetical protein
VLTVAGRLVIGLGTNWGASERVLTLVWLANKADVPLVAATDELLATVKDVGQSPNVKSATVESLQAVQASTKILREPLDERPQTC